MAKKILIADDDEKIQFLLQQTLKDAGHRVLKAGDGEEAMQVIRAEKPDLLLLDIVMPKMHGYEVCRQIRSDPDPKISKMKIVVVSIKNYPVNIKAAENLGVDKYIIKPFSVRELPTLIADLLNSPAS